MQSTWYQMNEFVVVESGVHLEWLFLMCSLTTYHAMLGKDAKHMVPDE